MPNNDRKGKWQSFDALSGYKSSLRNVEKERGKIKKPVLFPDELEALNNKLNKYATNKAKIEITFYNNGYLEQVYGIIFKVDYINKEIVLLVDEQKEKLKVNLITNIKEA